MLYDFTKKKVHEYWTSVTFPSFPAGETWIRTFMLSDCYLHLWMICLRVLSFATMMTSSNGNIFSVTDPLCGEFTGHRWIPRLRPVTQSFDVLFDLRLNKRLSKQSRGWLSKTPSGSLWRHCYEFYLLQHLPYVLRSILINTGLKYIFSVSLI